MVVIPTLPKPLDLGCGPVEELGRVIMRHDVIRDGWEVNRVGRGIEGSDWISDLIIEIVGHVTDQG